MSIRKKIQVLRELHQVVETARDGSVKKTSMVKEVWLDLPEEGPPVAPPGYQYVVLSDPGRVTVRMADGGS